MRKILYLLLPIALIAISISSCSSSSDDTAFNPYLEQEKSPFYPNEIRIEKQSGKRDISEKWTFEYNTDRTISAYTHETTTKQQKEGYIETTVEKESGSLSYYPITSEDVYWLEKLLQMGFRYKMEVPKEAI